VKSSIIFSIKLNKTNLPKIEPKTTKLSEKRSRITINIALWKKKLSGKRKNALVKPRKSSKDMV